MTVNPPLPTRRGNRPPSTGLLAVNPSALRGGSCTSLIFLTSERKYNRSSATMTSPTYSSFFGSTSHRNASRSPSSAGGALGSLCSTFNFSGWLCNVPPSTSACIDGIVHSPAWTAVKVRT
jgi:hypothetical protein